MAHCISLHANPMFVPSPLACGFISTFKFFQNKCWTIYQRHSDLASSFALLTLNTVLLASKIFRQIPVLIPRASLVLLNYTGTIWLNVQIRSFFKSCQDFRLAVRLHDGEGMILTASKVLVKGMNILLTTGLFAASLISLAGFPAAALGMYTIMRNPAMAGWILGIFNDISDYCQNKKLLRHLHQVNASYDADIRIQLIVRNFIEMVHPKACAQLPDLPVSLKRLNDAEKMTAMHIVRQSGEYLLFTFKEALGVDGRLSKTANSLAGLEKEQTWKFYQGLAEGIQRKQDLTRANLGLIGLGYVCLGFCRMYPDTVIQYGVTWGMSLLYTGKLVYQKYHQKKLQRQIA